eukprot:823207_1
MSNDTEQPFLNDLRVQAPNTTDTNIQKTRTDSSDLAYSIGIPQITAEDYVTESLSHHEHLDSPPSPRSPYSNNNNNINSNSNPHIIQQTLSKKLFNLEHYITIPLMFLLSFFVYYDRGGLASSLDNAQEQLLHDNA